jgi:hypothetical protein
MLTQLLMKMLICRFFKNAGHFYKLSQHFVINNYEVECLENNKLNFRWVFLAGSPTLINVLVVAWAGPWIDFGIQRGCRIFSFFIFFLPQFSKNIWSEFFFAKLYIWCCGGRR